MKPWLHKDGVLLFAPTSSEGVIKCTALWCCRWGSLEDASDTFPCKLMGLMYFVPSFSPWTTATVLTRETQPCFESEILILTVTKIPPSNLSYSYYYYNCI